MWITPLQSLKDTVLSYVSLFSGAGIGCSAFDGRGFTCVATSELQPRRLAVQHANKVGWRDSSYILGDLSLVETKNRVLEEVASWVSSKKAEITAVIATPPCQGISVANHKKKPDEIHRNSLVLESLDLISEIKPKYFILENVRGFLKAACKEEDHEVETVAEAIDRKLAAHYNFETLTDNLKNYGSPSSRTRTIVIGVRSDIHGVSPAELFPAKAEAPMLHHLISDLPKLERMGEWDPEDYFHAFRKYQERMRPWITATQEGESAFANTDPSIRPHRIIDGKRIENKSQNGDKYRRAKWDKVAPCVHTRNDILASQSTVHPVDDRVFSIRELSRMMGINSSFIWSSSQPIQGKATDNEIQHFYKEHEVNVRQCLGESVPVPVFESIADKILHHQEVSRRGPKRINYSNNFTFGRFKEFEDTNPNKKEHSAFYTRQDIAFRLIRDLKERLGHVTKLRVLEPSVGVGALLPELFRQFHKSEIQLDIVDIDENALKLAKETALLNLPEKNIRVFHGDFLNLELDTDYDVILGNPPFGRQKGVAKDLSELFMRKALDLGRHIAFVMPKSILNAPKYNSLRSEMSKFGVTSIDDFGEAAFDSVGIETVGITLSKNIDSTIKISSIPRKVSRRALIQTVIDPTLPTWLLYRNGWFDTYLKKYQLGNFKVVRDRELKKSDLSTDVGFPVYRGRDIPREIKDELVPNLYLAPGRTEPKSSKHYATHLDALIVPNLSYYPRARELPKNSYVDGSAAVLLPRNKINVQETISQISDPEFSAFYRIARNYSTRSLNVDSNSVFYWPSVLDKDEI